MFFDASTANSLHGCTVTLMSVKMNIVIPDSNPCAAGKFWKMGH